MNQVLFSFKMEKYASFVEMSMIHITISKAQLVSYVTFKNSYVKILTMVLT